MKDETISFDMPQGMTLSHNAWSSKKGDLRQTIGFDYTKSKRDFLSYVQYLHLVTFTPKVAFKSICKHIHKDNIFVHALIAIV